MLRPYLTTALFVFLTALFGTAGLPHAATYPEKPIQLIIPFDQGGGTSALGRFYQQAIQDEKFLPKPMPIMYMPGAGGTVGARQVLNSAPDGYTLLLWNISLFGSKAMGNVEFGYEDFTPICSLGSTPFVLVVREGTPWTDVKTLFSDASAKPNTIPASVNMGASSHIGLVLTEKASPDARFRHVQFNGTSKAYTALLGGHVDVGVLPVSTVITVASKGIRPLAVLSAKRDAQLPDVPTLMELGYNVNFELHNWLLAPKGLDPAKVKQLADAFEKALHTEYVTKNLKANAFEPNFLRDEPMLTYMKNQNLEINNIAPRLRGEQ